MAEVEAHQPSSSTRLVRLSCSSCRRHPRASPELRHSGMMRDAVERECVSSARWRSCRSAAQLTRPLHVILLGARSFCWRWSCLRPSLNVDVDALRRPTGLKSRLGLLGRRGRRRRRSKTRMGREQAPPPESGGPAPHPLTRRAGMLTRSSIDVASHFGRRTVSLKDLLHPRRPICWRGESLLSPQRDSSVTDLFPVCISLLTSSTGSHRRRRFHKLISPTKSWITKSSSSRSVPARP